MRSSRLSGSLGRSIFACLLLFWGPWASEIVPALAAQEQQPAPVTGATPNASDQSHLPDTSHVAPNDAVIRIGGLCDNQAEGKVAIANCETVITRAEFEKIIRAVQPDMKVRAQREFAERYATALVMAKKAERMGLSKGEDFEEQMKVARVQILSLQLKKAIEQEAAQISEADLERFYHDHTKSFEQAELERIYVPRTQDSTTLDKSSNDSDKRMQSQRMEQTMRALAAKLRARAVAGEDFHSLQADAYNIAGMKNTSNPRLGTIRRISLPPNQVSVMDLKPGEVSPIIETANGYMIYRMNAKDTLPIDKVRDEIKGVLRSQRLEGETQEIEDFAPLTLNEVFFRSQGSPRSGDKAADRSDSQ